MQKWKPYNPEEVKEDGDYELNSVTIYNEEDIKNEFIRNPRDLYYYNQEYAVSIKKLLRAKANVKVVKAMQWYEIKDELVSAYGKATVEETKMALELDEKVMNALAKEIECEYQVNRLKGVTEAIRAKKDSLISLGATVRAEMSPASINKINQ